MQYKISGLSGRFGRAAAVIVFSLALGACSAVPDWANPVEWYKGTAEWIRGDDDETIAARKAARSPENAPPNADQPFPALSTVPARPQGIDTRDQRRRQVESGLVADRSRARHAALGPGDSPKPSPRSVPGAPARPVLAAPKTAAVAPARPVLAAPKTAAVAPATGNQAFQRAIAQQSAAGGATRRSLGPIRRNTMATPPSPRGTLALIPPRASAARGAQLKMATPPRPVAGPIGPTARSVSVGTVYFANGSAKISGKYTKTLRAIAAMQKKRGGTLRVIGHASSRTRDIKPLGHQLANFRISLARAKAVAHQLMHLGAPSSSVAVSGVADNQPIYHEFMPLGEAANRRAEIYLDN
ncbi:MAG: OmpA family protein [Alphaproteobacteria bacterium]